MILMKLEEERERDRAPTFRPAIVLVAAAATYFGQDVDKEGGSCEL
jgi:hypothetical protein